MSIYLPRAAAERPVRVPARRVGQRSDTSTLLVVEDEDLVRALVRRTLQREGYHVLDAPNAHFALEIVQQCGAEIDLLLTDVVMPGLSGRELATQLERDFPLMAIVLMSGYVGEFQAIVSPNGTRRHFLHKPFTLGELKATVQHALDERAVAL